MYSSEDGAKLRLDLHEYARPFLQIEAGTARHDFRTFIDQQRFEHDHIVPTPVGADQTRQALLQPSSAQVTGHVNCKGELPPIWGSYLLLEHLNIFANVAKTSHALV